jgi:translation initiation factor 4A
MCEQPLCESWDDMGLNTSLLRGIYAYGFEKPSPIQQKAIVPMVKGGDIIAQAQSGTGKTGAFVVAMIQNIDATKNTTQGLILSPTRELSFQTLEVVKSLGNYIKNLRTQLLVGGTSSDIDKQNILNNTPHIVIGCPGRTFDMIRKNVLHVKTINSIVIDEADEMLSTGFKEQVYNIFQYMNNNIQVCLFSATLPPEVCALSEKFMREPTRVLVKSDMLTLEGIEQYYVSIEDDRDKYATLKDLYQQISVSQCIIYCNSIKRVEDLYNAMTDDKFPVCCIHSGMEKDDRTNAFNNFKVGKFRVMISSNITARGIDIQQVSTVINFDVPKDVHSYLHRIGRSGRWGRKGVGINFITRRDCRKIREYEQYYSTEIRELPADFNAV